MRRTDSLLLLVAGLTASLAAQERIPAAPPADAPRFEVVSIKRVSGSRSERSIGEQPGGRFVLSAMPIAPLIRSAYRSDTDDLIGAPDWVLSEEYDLAAQAGRAVGREQMTAMLQALLAERFKLAAHYEMQERPVYALRPARADGRLGANIRRSELDCEAIDAARRGGSGGPFPLPANGAPACGMAMRGGNGMQLLTGGLPLARLMGSIGAAAGRVVVDKTGLTGNYEITLRFMPQQAQNNAPDAPPDIFTALQEQLGLKLEPDRAPVRVLVIDHIERPTENRPT